VALESSSVAANCVMNRERQLAGANSYTRELGFNPVDLVRDAVESLTGQDAPAGWLDLCCGTGRALVQAATRLRRDGLAHRTALVGVDLVDAFDPVPEELPNLRLVCSPVAAWTPALELADRADEAMISSGHVQGAGQGEEAAANGA
jgi:hypothetical protein